VCGGSPLKRDRSSNAAHLGYGSNRVTQASALQRKRLPMTHQDGDEERIRAALLRLDNARRAMSAEESKEALAEYEAARVQYAEALKAADRPVPEAKTDPLGTGTE
jgi:hypothetical protein